MRETISFGILSSNSQIQFPMSGKRFFNCPEVHFIITRSLEYEIKLSFCYVLGGLNGVINHGEIQ